MYLIVGLRISTDSTERLEYAPCAVPASEPEAFSVERLRSQRAGRFLFHPHAAAFLTPLKVVGDRYSERRLNGMTTEAGLQPPARLSGDSALGGGKTSTDSSEAGLKRRRDDDLRLSRPLEPLADNPLG